MALALQKQCVLARRALKGELVEGQDATTGLPGMREGQMGIDKRYPNGFNGGLTDTIWMDLTIKMDLNDAVARALGDAEGAHGKLGNLEEALVVRDSADNDDNDVLRVLRSERDNLGDADGRAVRARHAEATQDDLVKLAVRATSKEAVELNVDEERLQKKRGVESQRCTLTRRRR